MPYEYRRMTPEERASTMAARRERGYPLHAPPHPYRNAGWYCITAANYEHVHIMASSMRRSALEDRLVVELAAVEADVGGWVVLTNHYPVLAGVESLDQLSLALKRTHGVTAREWNLEDGLTGQRKVWYKFRDRSIRNEGHYYHALNYIHYNAVKHGYVDSPYDWTWCSGHRYCDTLGREWLREQWVRHPIADAWAYGDGE